jgi:hypothetical protein
MRKLALYEVPFIVDNTRRPFAADYRSRLQDMIAHDRRGEAVEYFMAAVHAESVRLAHEHLGLVEGLEGDGSHAGPRLHHRCLPSRNHTAVLVPEEIFDKAGCGFFRQG